MNYKNIINSIWYNYLIVFILGIIIGILFVYLMVMPYIPELTRCINFCDKDLFFNTIKEVK